MSKEDAAKVLHALRIAKGMLHEDEQREPLKTWYAEVAEACAIQESELARLQCAA